MASLKMSEKQMARYRVFGRTRLSNCSEHDKDTRFLRKQYHEMNDHDQAK